MGSAEELFDGDSAVRTAAEAVFAAQNELTKIREALRDRSVKAQQHGQTKEEDVAALTAEAVRDLTPTDLDEVRAIRNEPPPSVQVVATCVCSLISMPRAAPPFAPSPTLPPSPTGGSSPSLPPISPSGRHTGVAPSVMLPASIRSSPPPATARTRGPPIVTWETAQKLLGQREFKSRLLSFDPRRLLEPDAADLLNAVRERIAVADVADLSPSPPKGKKKGGTSWRHAAIAATASTELERCPLSSARKSSLASVAARARRASIERVEDLVALGPLSLKDASHGSKCVGALFLWASRVLANVDMLRAAEEAGREADLAAGRELRVMEAAVREAEQRLAELDAALRCAEEDARRKRAAEQAAEEKRERERREMVALAEARAEAARKAASADAQRRAEMRQREEDSLRKQEEERTARSERGDKAVLEVVDVVIKQKVEFRAGSVSANARGCPRPLSRIGSPRLA